MNDQTKEPVSAETIRALVASRIESDEPDAVLEVFRQNDGKPFTKRILAKLPGGAERWGIRHVANMTNLETKDYLRSDGGVGISLLVCYGTVNVPIDAKFLEERNPAYFAGRKERNAKRLTTMNDPLLCREMAQAVENVRTAQRALGLAMEAYERLTGYGEAFNPDQYEINKFFEEGKK